MKINFYGGAEVVTGANYLINAGKTNIVVDCGLFQGSEELQEMNYLNFPYDPRTIDYVFITHSHLDHCGRLARLVKLGFQGKIICTPPTRDLMAVALADSVDLMAEDARNKGHETLFNKADLKKTIKMITAYDYKNKTELNSNLTFNLNDAGHILGSSIIELWLTEDKKTTKITFTGDLGNPPTPLLNDPAKIEHTDYLVIESAYGDRLHEDKSERKILLERTIEDAITQKAVLLIPSFAMERTQELLYELNSLVENNRIPKVPIFIDSPLAIKITEVYKRYPQYFNKKARYEISTGDDLFNFPGLKLTTTRDESMEIMRVPEPKIIIAGSGMSTGGRILFHEKLYLSNPKNIFLVIGFQVEGTLGRKIFDRQPMVQIFGENIKNRIQVKAIGGYSAHADQKQLLNFIDQIKKPLQKIFIVQGESKAAESLKKEINKDNQLEAVVPKFEEAFEL